jgi:signal transduction histidine kinase
MSGGVALSAGDLPPDEITRSLEWRMRRFLIIMRVLGWFWMLLLVATTLASDDAADRTITIGAMVLATVWTGVTWWAAQTESRVTSSWFLVSDGVVCLAIATASYAADAGDLFHGGYPISWLVVLAYGRGMGVALAGSLILVVQQSFLLLQSGRSAVSAVGSIVFVLYAVIFGWLFGMIRRSDQERRVAVAELTVEREANARRLERLELANKLHDSVLQTLQVMDTDAEDAERVRSLARRQTRELRTIVDTYASNMTTSLRSALLAVASDIEDLFDVNVSSVIRVDMEMNPTLDALVEASREAMTNSAKYSGTHRIDLYAAVEDGTVAIYIRDEGRGFDVEHAQHGHGLENSVRGRVAEVGGNVAIDSTKGEGTEVKVSAVPRGSPT